MDVTGGFHIADRFVPWGTEMGDVPAFAGQPVPRDDFAHRIDLAFSTPSAFGLPAIVASVRGPEQNRPATTVEYELLSAGTPDDNETGWLGVLSPLLGPPTDVGRADVRDLPIPSSGVTRWASWRQGDVTVGLSVYGGTRKVRKRLSGGLLWLKWADMAAARPYVDSWLKTAAGLDAAGADATVLGRFTLSQSQYPRYAMTDAPDGERQAGLVLYAPDILPTPARIAAQLTAKQIAVWATADRLCLSTLHDSHAWPRSLPFEVRFVDGKPAKGGGYTVLSVGPFWIQDWHASRGLAAAAELLAGQPGARLIRSEEYDC